MALQASKTCKVWISLNPSVFSNGCLRTLDGISPIFLFFLNSDKVFSRIFALIHCCWMPFTVSYFPFYSAILGFPRYHWFRRYHWFPLFPLLGTRTNVVSATLVASLFLILHYFILWDFLFQKPQLTFPFWGVLEGWPLVFLLSRLLDSTFLDPTFGCFSFCHFFQVS